jgi:hypothetical protein
MASTYLYDRDLCARKDRAAASQDDRHIVEQEFSEAMRDPRFRPGWYILPFFGLAIAAIVIILL